MKIAAATALTALALTAGPGLPGSAAGSSTASTADAIASAGTACVVVRHRKRIVRRVVIRRGGKRIVRKRVRILRWVTCKQVPASAPSGGSAPGTTATLGVLAYDQAADCSGQGTDLCLKPTRSAVPAGKVRIQLQNHGEDPHTLRLYRTDGPGGPFAIPSDLGAELPPGQQASGTFTLARGSWYLFCSITGHEGQGMSANLTVN